VRIKLGAGAEINARDFIGRTALHLGAENGHLVMRHQAAPLSRCLQEIVRFLIKKGALLFALDNEGGSRWLADD
jgi:ankyrin repeat protein